MWSRSTHQRESLSSLRACTFLSSQVRLLERRANRRFSAFPSSSGLAVARPRAGFTLLEVMIVVAIVAILATIALPAYSQYITRANRTQAKQFLQDIANRQEQYLLDQRSYTATIGSGGLEMTPPTETSGLYTFGADTDTGVGKDCLGAGLPVPGYTITATAIGGQASDGALCLDSVNNKTPADKWQK